MKSYLSILIRFALLLGVLTMLSGCGATKTSNTDGFGSTSSSSVTSPTTQASDTTFTACSKNIDTTGINVLVEQYVDDTGAIRPDLIRLKFQNAPQSWQDQNWDLQFYRWIASPDNSASIDSTALQFQFENRNGSQFQLVTPNNYVIFNWAETVEMGNYINGTGVYGTVSTSSPQSFYSTVSLVVNLRDSTNSYQVVRAVFRNGSAVANQMDILIPTFQADPARYAADTRHPSSLQALHPLIAQLGQNYTQLQFQQMANANCF